MSTPFNPIFRKFNNKLTDKEIAKVYDDKRKALLEDAIPIFVGQTSVKVTADFDNEIISEDLTDKDMSVLAMLMYDGYLNQEITLKNALLAIKTDGFSIGSTDKKVDTLEKQQEKNMSKIDAMFATYL